MPLPPASGDPGLHGLTGEARSFVHERPPIDPPGARVYPRPALSMLIPRSRYATIDGHRIHYWDKGDGPPLLLVHGLGNSTLVWYRVMDGLAQHRRVVAVDLPGHGWSDMPQQRFGLAEGARFLAHFTQLIAEGPWAVAGASMGGSLALELALARPDLVRGLVLAGSAGLGREIAPSLRVLSLPIIGELIEHPTPERLRRVIRNLILYNPANLDEEWLAAVFQQRSRPGAAQTLLRFLRVGVNAWGQKRSARLDGRLGELQTPLLLTWGRQDRVAPVTHGQRAARLRPGASLEVFDECGHWPFIEHPTAFVQTVDQFLATISIPVAPPTAPERPLAS